MARTLARELTRQAYDLAGLRQRAGIARQDEMARRMGISPRTYYALEADPVARMDEHYRLLADIASLALAIECGNAKLATPRAARLAREFSALPNSR